jgi:hypothetical protein
MALRHRQEKETSQLKGVNQVDEETDLDLGEFTLLQNWIPAEIYSIKKKRGTAPLNEGGLLPITIETGDVLITEDGRPIITEF